MINDKPHSGFKVLDTPYPTHGGNLQAVSNICGIDSLIDFSASINPLAPPKCISQLLLETPQLLREYPDPHCSTITQNISKATGIPDDLIRVTNGSTEMIYLLPHLLRGNQEIAIFDPCFSEYEKAFTAFGFQPKSIPLSCDNHFHMDPSKFFPILDSIPQLGAIVMGHPASPSGKLYNSALPLLHDYCQKRNSILIVDEAFIDFSSTNNSVWNLLNYSPHLILIRSLTKFYSIPGLRVGYGVLHPEKSKLIDSHQYPWSVNALAQAVGAEVVLDIDFQNKTNKWLVSERNFMFESLSSIPDIEVFSSEANFILFRIRDNNSFLDQHLYQHLLSQSLLIRNCGNFKSLDESFFRISLRERLDNLKILDSINEFFSIRHRDFKK
jgi:threonine-phosphate decarboxylase